jgi:hypothetical protein
MRSDRALTVLYSAALLALVGVASSCSVWRSITGDGGGPPPRAFNHLAHLDRGLTCQTCHEGAETNEVAGMPSKSLCMDCHEQLDQAPGVPPEKTVAQFLDEKGEPAWSRFTKQSDEIKFSHARHAAGKVDCLSCHAGMDKDAGLRPAGMLQRMSSCVACHEKDAKECVSCESCHSVITAATRPPNHDKDWKRTHGHCSREGGEVATGNSCTMCHQKDSCVACHMTEMPENHTQHWRMRGHGIAATVDRDRCQTCHTSDGCTRCHQETEPLSHTATFQAPRNRHCMSCHLPLQSSGSCFVCHKSTPGHDTATPMPAWHNPGLNCRSCHALSLRHPDNGDSCISCHR